MRNHYGAPFIEKIKHPVVDLSTLNPQLINVVLQIGSQRSIELMPLISQSLDTSQAFAAVLCLQIIQPILHGNCVIGSLEEYDLNLRQ
jgi:hypothetical protein